MSTIYDNTTDYMTLNELSTKLDKIPSGCLDVSVYPCVKPSDIDDDEKLIVSSHELIPMDIDDPYSDDNTTYYGGYYCRHCGIDVNTSAPAIDAINGIIGDESIESIETTYMYVFQ